MNINEPLITVITVVYNNALPLEKTIQSVLQLPYSNIDFIIIDGGSTDGTVEVIKKYQHKLKYWVSEPDKGIYDAMNKGWEKADENSYIIFLGAGDYIKRLPDMHKHLKDDIIYGKVYIGNKYLFNTKVDFRLKFINAVHHQALLIKKSIHPLPPFNLKFPVFADFDFNQRLYKSRLHFIKDNSFCAYAMEGGVSSMYNTKEIFDVVRNNFGSKYVMAAKIYYLFLNFKNKLTGIH